MAEGELYASAISCRSEGRCYARTRPRALSQRTAAFSPRVGTLAERSAPVIVSLSRVARRSACQGFRSVHTIRTHLNPARSQRQPSNDSVTQEDSVPTFCTLHRIRRTTRAGSP